MVLAAAAAVGFAAFAPVSGASDSRWPDAWEEGAYVVRRLDTGEALWRVTWGTAVSEESGRRVARIRERGEGQPLGREAPIVWEKRMKLQVAPDVRMEGLTESRWDLEGNLLEEMEVEVDSAIGRIRYRDTGKPDGRRWRALPWNERAIADDFLFHWARGLSFEDSPAGECLLLLSPSRRIRMRAEVEGREEVRTPAGVFSCYRVRLKPLGMLRVPPFQIFAPEMRLWCTVESPHRWVRYQGAIGGPGSPEAVIELTEFTAGT